MTSAWHEAKYWIISLCQYIWKIQLPTFPTVLGVILWLVLLDYNHIIWYLKESLNRDRELVAFYFISYKEHLKTLSLCHRRAAPRPPHPPPKEEPPLLKPSHCIWSLLRRWHHGFKYSRCFFPAVLIISTRPGLRPSRSPHDVFVASPAWSYTSAPRRRICQPALPPAKHTLLPGAGPPRGVGETAGGEVDRAESGVVAKKTPRC